MRNNKNIVKILLLISLSVLIPFAFVVSAMALFGSKEESDNPEANSGGKYLAQLFGEVFDSSDFANGEFAEISSYDKSIYEESSDDMPQTEISIYAESSDDMPQTDISTYDEKSSAYGCDGFIWMSIEQMRDEIEFFRLQRHDGDTSYPAREIELDEFFRIIETIKKYEWKTHKQYMNSFSLGASNITVVGHNTVYTYLIIGRDESDRCFVWSFYDYKIAYITEEDLEFIEDILFRGDY